MLLFNRQYFKGLIAIPNANSQESGLLNDDLESWQEELLIERLGTNTYVDFLDNINASSGIWYDLIYGTTYTDASGDKRIYRGLVDKDRKLSPLADYCYLRFVAQNYGSLTATGETVKNEQKSATEISNTKLHQVAARLVSGFAQVDQYIRDMQDLDSANFPDYELKYPLQFSTNSLGL